jgi:hypothetical protein
MNYKSVYTFSEAYQMFLSQGTPIKRIGWLGYWVLEGEDLVMYCKNGDVVHLSKGCNPSLTLTCVAADDWMPVYDDLCKELDMIRESRILVQETGGRLG